VALIHLLMATLGIEALALINSFQLTPLVCLADNVHVYVKSGCAIRNDSFSERVEDKYICG
jgi:hypothetical protein